VARGVLMQLMLNHKRLDLWNVNHLMAMRFWIHTAECLTATAAGGGHIGDDSPLQCSAGRRLRLAPGCPSCPPRLRPVLLLFSLPGGLKPAPSLDGGLEEFLELRPFCSSSWATRADNASS